MTSRHYCFTSYNLEMWNPEVIKTRENNGHFPKYLVYQYEKCPTTGNVHVQGYLELKSPMREAGIKKLFQDAQLRFFERRGTRTQARHYCMCNGAKCTSECTLDEDRRQTKIRLYGPTEFGEFRADNFGQGKRTDLEKIKAAILAGEDMDSIVSKYFETYAKYERAILKFRNLCVGQRDFKTVVNFIKAPVGVNVIDMIYNTHPKEKCWTMEQYNIERVKFDGYDPIKHDIIIIDSYEGQIDRKIFLKLLGKNSYTGDLKYSIVPLKAKIIYIISNKAISLWYPIEVVQSVINLIDFYYEISAENTPIYALDMKQYHDLEPVDDDARTVVITALYSRLDTVHQGKSKAARGIRNSYKQAINELNIPNFMKSDRKSVV